MPNDNASYLGLAWSIVQANDVQLSVAVTVLYHQLTCLATEIRLLWPRRRHPTPASTLHIMTRVFSWIYASGAILSVPGWNNVIDCKVTMTMTIVSGLALSVLWAAFSALRVFAISGRSLPPTIIVLGFSIIPFITNLYLATQTDTTELTLSPDVKLCVGGANVSMRLMEIIQILNPVVLILSDTLSIAITWRKTFRVRAQARSINMSVPVINLLLKNGTTYFLVFLAVNGAQLASFLHSPNILSPASYARGSTCVIITDFLLRLRESAERALHGPDATLDASPSADLRFASVVVDSMGGEIDEPFSFYESDSQYQEDGDGGSRNGDNSEEHELLRTVDEEALSPKWSAVGVASSEWTDEDE